MHGDLRPVARRVATFKTPNGKEVVLCSLVLGDFASACEQALQEYRRDKIKAWTANADLMPESERTRWIREAFEKAEKITVEDLPKKAIEVADLDKDGNFQHDEDGEIKTKMKKGHHYVEWWMSQTVSGKLYSVWLSMRRAPGQEKVTLEEADELFTAGLESGANALEEAAQLVGDLSRSELAKNSQTPQEAGTENTKEASPIGA